MTTRSEDPRIDFILRLGMALHRYGVSAHRLEGALTRVANTLGLQGNFFSTPTALMISLDCEGRTHLLRSEPGNVELGRLCSLDDIGNRVIAGELSPAAGSLAIEEALNGPIPYSAGVTVTGHIVGSAAAAVFLGGSAADAIVSGVAGLVIGLLAIVAGRSTNFARLFLIVASVAAAGVAWAAAAVGAPVAVLICTIAGLIVFVPGLSLTTAMTELANGHLASGTARLSYVAIVLIQMGLGVTLASQFSGAAEITQPELMPTLISQGWWWMAVALPFAALSFVILLRAELWDTGWIFLAGAAALSTAMVLGNLADPTIGSFGGALVATGCANVLGRWQNRPAANVLVPTLFLLVPGSLGLRSVSRMLDHDVLGGVHAAFEMSLIAIALVAGILVANLLFPARRHL